ncbi:acyl-CoA thioesterase [Corallococcus llansteffanensis]|uniref:Acyl-CoA thioesterase n=1 Tax=Corallococcus llansteffanensis TaxID=2316731 RepID=A0A3A8PBS0_9BACT|nr:thioesterase family protein [Corallococcus llansteffanensis]RKH49144.1 acyl-CoA thioesterase [Corallococcus llansteffanensis]
MSDTPLKDFPVVVTFPVHWGDMDAYGHVNNVRSFTWFESARIAYMVRVGLVGPSAAGADKTVGGGIGPILANTHADYVRPVVFPANLVVGARVTRVGTSSITFEHVVAGADDGVVYTRGGSIVVTLRYATHEKVPVPQAIRAAIEQLEGRSAGG